MAVVVVLRLRPLLLFLESPGRGSYAQSNLLVVERRQQLVVGTTFIFPQLPATKHVDTHIQ